MEAYGISVGQASRFVPPKENKKTLEKVAAGKIDILIGTHKILGKDVLFYDLGLVIVDEEQEHRAVCARIAHEVPGLTITYREPADAGPR